ncbi:MAG: hypothetical protein AAF639_39745 [Chloroflexota bacterium]
MTSTTVGILLIFILTISGVSAMAAIRLERRWRGYQQRKLDEQAGMAMPMQFSTNGHGSSHHASNGQTQTDEVLQTDIRDWLGDEVHSLQEKVSSSVPESVKQFFKDPLLHLPKRHQEETVTAEAFVAWVDQTYADETTLREWLHVLSPTGLDALIERLSDFTQDIGVELIYLVTNQLDIHPNVAELGKSVVLRYLQSCYDAVELHEEAMMAETYIDFANDPSRPEYRDFCQKVYEQLLSNGHVVAMPAELVLASEKEKSQYMMQSVVEVANKTPDLFSQALSDSLDSVSDKVH